MVCKRLLHLSRLVHASPLAHCSMSLSCSSGQKLLQSPFSHADLYGVQHPLCNGSSNASSSLPSTAPVKQKPKPPKRKKSTKSAGLSEGTSMAKPKSRKRKSIKVSSAPTVLPVRKQTLKAVPPSTAPSTFSLAQVDASSPSGSRKPPRVHRNYRPNGTHSTTSNGTCTNHHKATPNNAHTDHRTPATHIIKANPAKVDSATPSTVPSDGRDTQQSTRAKSKELAPLSSPISTLLTFSNMSTSEVVLRMGGRLASNALGGPVCSSNKQIPSLHLPPHMKVHRQAFHTSSRQLGTFGRRKGAWPLNVEEISRGLGRLQYQHIIVMSGAGVSTSSGIPDFRTPGTGLYDNLRHYSIPDPTSIFDIAYFSCHPKPFFALARELYPGRYQPNVAHYFVRLLQEKNLLLRNYTQNIDGLERIAGVCAGKLVEAHGSFASASCIQCSTKHSAAEVKTAIFDGKTPRCKHKHCYGLVKPDIVFFGEDLPARFYALQRLDFSKCDLLIIMGTSLEVEPFASLATLPAGNVPRLLLNRELVGPFRHKGRAGRPTDVAVTGDLVESVTGLVRGAGWEEELRRLCGYREEEEGEEGDSGERENRAGEHSSAQASKVTSRTNGDENRQREASSQGQGVFKTPQSEPDGDENGRRETSSQGQGISQSKLAGGDENGRREMSSQNQGIFKTPQSKLAVCADGDENGGRERDILSSSQSHGFSQSEPSEGGTKGRSVRTPKLPASDGAECVDGTRERPSSCSSSQPQPTVFGPEDLVLPLCGLSLEGHRAEEGGEPKGEGAGR